MDQQPAHSSRQRYADFRSNREWKRHVHDETGEGDPQHRADWHSRRGYLNEYKQLVRPYLANVIKLVILGMFAAALDLAWPAIGGYIIDRILQNDALDVATRHWHLTVAGLLALATVFGSRWFDTYRNINTIRLNHKMIVRLRRRLHRHLLRLPLRELYGLKTGTIVSRLSGDIDKCTGLLQMAIMSPLAAFWRVLFATVILFAWNWRLAVAAWAVLPPMILVSLIWVRKIRPIFRSAGRDRNLIDARATETFSGIRVVRSFRREPRERHDYTVADNTMTRKHLFGHGTALVVDSFWMVLIPLSGVLVVWVGGYMYLNKIATIGQIVAFQAYSTQLLFPIYRIVSALSQTQEAMAAMERVFELLERPIDKPDAPDAVEAPRRVRNFEFDHVCFAYDEAVGNVITDFSLNVPGHSVVALVGPSGAGKTTITDLIARFYDPTDGAIRLNGIDIRRFKLHSYRRLLAVVPQDVFLFDGTVRQNISYGRRGATESRIIDAARRANALGFIEQLPRGFDTLIGERGVKLSGGQRQRISIARAILADPAILVLDEATSNLDTESEQLIQAALADLYANRTTFVIAHRLSTVTHADLIVCMDGGRIVETGTHEQLMAAQGMYYHMVERQRKFDVQTHQSPVVSRQSQALSNPLADEAGFPST